MEMPCLIKDYLTIDQNPLFLSEKQDDKNISTGSKKTSFLHFLFFCPKSRKVFFLEKKTKAGWPAQKKTESSSFSHSLTFV
jgi:hypothetical protein